MNFSTLHCLLFQHLEAGLVHMRKRVSEDPSSFEGIVVMDPIFHQKYLPECTSSYEETTPVENFTASYFLGLYPSDYPKSWESAKLVYTPFNIDNEHWIALEINLAEKVINAYDFNHYIVSAEKLVDHLRGMAEWLPIHLDKAGVIPNFQPSTFHINKVPDLVHDTTGYGNLHLQCF